MKKNTAYLLKIGDSGLGVYRNLLGFYNFIRLNKYLMVSVFGWSDPNTLGCCSSSEKLRNHELQFEGLNLNYRVWMARSKHRD